MNVNVNEKVRIKLTEYGKSTLLIDHISYWSKKKQFVQYVPPKEDADGWSTWQLWSVMNAFGKHMYPGAPLCFETIMKLDRETKVDEQPKQQSTGGEV